MSIDAIKLALEALQDIARQPEGDEQSAQAVAKEVIPLLRAAIKQPRQWQGLTDAERNEFRQWAHPEIIEAIELKLKERNA